MCRNGIWFAKGNLKKIAIVKLNSFHLDRTVMSVKGCRESLKYMIIYENTVEKSFNTYKSVMSSVQTIASNVPSLSI